MNLKLCQITKEFSLDGFTTITSVKDVTLNISPGEFIIIIGRSGSGKTTLLNLAAGLIKPTSGEVLVDDININNLAENQLSRLRNQKIGFIFQFPSLLPSLTIHENVKIPAFFGLESNRINLEDKTDSLMQAVGIYSRRKAYPKQLSAGEQKRAVIARSLINNPQFLLADEPTSDLDVQTEKEIMALLLKIHGEGMTLLMVTHSLELVPYATRAFKMESGSLQTLVRSNPDSESINP